MTEQRTETTSPLEGTTEVVGTGLESRRYGLEVDKLPLSVALQLRGDTSTWRSGTPPRWLSGTNCILVHNGNGSYSVIVRDRKERGRIMTPQDIREGFYGDVEKAVNDYAIPHSNTISFRLDID